MSHLQWESKRQDAEKMLSLISPFASVQADCLGSRFGLIQLVLGGNNNRVDAPASTADALSTANPAPAASSHTPAPAPAPAARAIPQGEYILKNVRLVDLNDCSRDLNSHRGATFNAGGGTA